MGEFYAIALSLAFKGGGRSTFGFQRGGGGATIGFQRGSPLQSAKIIYIVPGSNLGKKRSDHCKYFAFLENVLKIMNTKLIMMLKWA